MPAVLPKYVKHETFVSKKLFIKTYGCQMNVYDSQRMIDTLTPLGYELGDRPEDADFIILNTCHIREKAAEKVYTELGRLKKLKQDKDLIIGVAGCVAQAEGQEMVRRAPSVDLVFGPQTYHRLPELLRQVEQDRAERQALQDSGAEANLSRSKKRKPLRLVDTDFPVEQKFDELVPDVQSQGPAAFLTVQEGCDKFCSFCVVPYTRGAEFSRPVGQVMDEAKRLVDQGVCELTLLGQNVNAYHGETVFGQTWGLGQLINSLAEIEGLERIRFTTSHPNDMTDDLYEAFRDQPKLMPYFHLPVQAGSDKILAAMNRKHNRQQYLDVIARLRDMRPDLAISGDFIVGFPGESDKDFAETLNIVTQVSYAAAYSFKYSSRPGTPAAGIAEQVPEVVKSERLAMLQELLNAQQEAFNYATKGRRLSVLMEREGRVDGQLVGRSPYMQAVHVEAPKRLLGSIVDIDVTYAGANSISGQVVTSDITHSAKQTEAA